MTADDFRRDVSRGRAVTDAVLFLLAFIIVTTIFVYHIYVFRNELQKVKAKLGKILSWLTFISVLFFWITSFFSMYTHNFSKQRCVVIQQILQIVYIIAKVTFWHVLGLRL